MNRVQRAYSSIFPSLADLPDYSQIGNRLGEFSEEKDGWDGPDSKAMNPDSCLNAISILTKMQKLGIARPSLTLSSTGNVYAAWRKETRSLAVVRFYARKYVVLVIDNDTKFNVSQEFEYNREPSEQFTTYLKETY